MNDDYSADSMDVFTELKDLKAKRYSLYKGQNGGTPVYSDIIKHDQVIGRIPAGMTPDFLYRGGYRSDMTENSPDSYHFVLFVQYQDLSGWAFEDDLYNPDSEEQSGVVEEMTEMQTGDPETNAETVGNIGEKIEMNDGDHVAQHSLPSGLITLICIGSAAVLIAAVIIVVVRRKRRVSNMFTAEDTTQKDCDV